MLVARVEIAEGDYKTQRLSSTLHYTAPARSHSSDAGLDLEASNFQHIFPGHSALVPHNLAVALPPNTFGLIVPRSSTLQSKGLIVVPGVIDPGFRGEVKTIVYNAGPRVCQIMARERVSQLLILPLISCPIREVKLDELSKTDRGPEGFGSTGGFLAGK